MTTQTIPGEARSGLIGLSLLLAVQSPVFGQTTNRPQFTATTFDAAGSIMLRWQSETNAVYRLDYGTFLATNMQWQTLYPDYPSHGTNTFWLEAGNNLLDPESGNPADITFEDVQVYTKGQ